VVQGTGIVMSNASDKRRRQLSLFEVLKNKTSKQPLLANDSEVDLTIKLNHNPVKIRILQW
jgi:hypothetical protein